MQTNNMNQSSSQLSSGSAMLGKRSLVVCLALLSSMSGVDAFAARAPASTSSISSPATTDAASSVESTMPAFVQNRNPISPEAMRSAPTLPRAATTPSMASARGLFTRKSRHASNLAQAPPAPQQRSPFADAEQSVTSHADWMELLHGNPDYLEDEITVVKFHASWCQSCKRLNHQWQGKVLRKYAGMDGIASPTEGKNTFKFASVEFGKNKQLCESLGINKLPTVKYFYKGQLLSSLTGGAKKMPQYTDAFETYQAATPSDLQFEVDLQARKASLQEAMATSADSQDQQQPKQKVSLKERLSAKINA